VLRRPRRAIAILTAAPIAIAALAGCAAGEDPAGDGRIAVVTSTNVYGSIASAIGGDRVAVESIVDSIASDPHDYEASARDQLDVSRADLIVVNGGGYDAFMDLLIDATGTQAPVIVASELAGDGDNEHVWFDVTGMGAVGQAIAASLADIDPAGDAEYRAGAEAFADRVAGLVEREAALAARVDGAGVLMTEPLPAHLLTATGFVDVTPAGFAEAIEEGSEVSVGLLDRVITTITSGQVALVVINEQTGGPETDAVRRAADEAGVPVVSFTETIPEGLDWVRWMSANIDEIERALS